MARRRKSIPSVKLPRKQEVSLREFRREVGALKKAGILSKTVNPRTQAPTRYMRRMVARNQDIIFGRAEAIKAPIETVRQYKEHGFRVRNNRVILPKSPGTKYVVKKGRIEAKASAKGGELTYIKVPIHFRSMDQFLRDLKRQAPDLDKLVGEGYRLGFRFYGNYSLNTFPNFSAMVDYFSRYESVIEGLRPGRIEQQQNQFMNLEFVKTTAEKLPVNPRQPRPPRFIPYSRRRTSAAKAGPEKEREFLAKRAERQRKRRLRADVKERENRKRAERRKKNG